MDKEIVLQSWVRKERQDWDGYEIYIEKFNRVKELINQIPSEEDFIKNILKILNLEAGKHKGAIREIFSRKSEKSWGTRKEAGPGIDRLDTGIKEYISMIKKEGLKISKAQEEEITKYLETINSTFIELFSIPFSEGATHHQARYQIPNGNKYIKLLQLLENLKDDNRTELEKYEYIGFSEGITPEVYKNKYEIWFFGKVIFELYGLINLSKNNVYTYNSKILPLFDFQNQREFDIYNFSDLFRVFNLYKTFEEKYEREFGFWLPNQKSYIDMLPKDMSPEQKANVLKHFELDQFFEYYNHEKDKKDGAVETEKEGEIEMPSSTGDDRSLNLILYGPPGTGKTYATRAVVACIEEGKNFRDILNNNLKAFINQTKDIFELIKKDERMMFVCFHPSYSYEDFIEGISAKTTDKGNIEYYVKDGKFKKICEKARKELEKNGENPKKFYIIIDEINRGNISKIFGELITLIEKDKRLGETNKIEVELPYSGDKDFGVPKNLYILGTMNTADRSIALVDLALRRRFEFLELMPNADLIDKVVDGINLKILLEKINERIVKRGERDKQIGHAYFMEDEKPIGSIEKIKIVWFNKILPLLSEYFYGRWDDIAYILSGKEISENSYVPFLRLIDSDEGIFDFKKKSDYQTEEFVNELKKIY